MTYIPNWEEFEKSAEMLYLRDPLNTRYSLKYSHSKGVFIVKITDNKKKPLGLQFFLPVNQLGYTKGKRCQPFGYPTFREQLQLCLQYKTEVQQDVRKIDKFISNLIRHMASNDN